MTFRRPLSRASLPVLALLVGACGGPPTPAPPPGAPPGYEALRESFGPADFGPLRGRVILLDPGHGGHFRGALGPNGLTEAEVNLGVALHLRGLLEWADATVHLTRTADRDFLTPADSTLASDLAFRVSIRDSIQPDVFLSIHHNSNATYDPTINETQTYHPLGADGASLDLARAIHRHLVKNLEITPAKILPGNFRVLRDATMPAVLGEPAMISHPGVANRLTLASKQRLEAAAYFLGLLDYFAAGDPGWRPHQPDTVVVGPAGADLRWSFAPERRERVTSAGSPGADPASFELRWNDELVPHRLSADGALVQWTAQPPAGGGESVLTLRGRNLAGRAAPVARTVLLPATGRELLVTITRDGPAADDGRALVAWATPDGSPTPAGTLVWPDGTNVEVAPDGVPEALLPAAEIREAPTFASEDDVAVEVRTRERNLPNGWSWRPLAGPVPAEPWRARVLAGAQLPPPAGRSAVPHADEVPVLWEAAGRTALAYDPGVGTTGDFAATRSLVPALEGLVVVVDPAGGGSDPDGTGPAGLRGAEVNLGTARQLARLLRGLGATAVLTREGSDASDPVAKIALAARVRADRFVTIGRSADAGATAAHHPGSSVGTPWAARTASACARLLADDAAVSVGPSWAYLLRHTACPAVEIRLPHAHSPDAERRLASPSWQAAEARAILRGLATAVAPELAASYDAIDLRAWQRALGLRPGRDRVVFDGQLPWYPMPGLGPAESDSLDSWGEPGLPLRDHGHVHELHREQTWEIGLGRRTPEGGTSLRLFARPAQDR